LKRFHHIVLSVVLLVSVLTGFSQSQQVFPAIEFVENKGQWDSRILFRGNAANGTVFLTTTGITYLLHSREDLDRVQEKVMGHAHGNGDKHKTATPNTEDVIVRSHSYNVDFEGARINKDQVRAEKPGEGLVSYFIGDDSTKWGRGCRIFQAVTYPDIYPNIDLRFYSDAGLLKYDFIIKPGGKVSDITLKYDGVDKISLKKGQLIISTSVGDVRELNPFSYQSKNGLREEVNCQYRLQGNRVKYEVKSYDATQPLIIDPSVVFSTFIGSTTDSWGFTATYGPDGSFYGGGIIFKDGLPTTPGAFQRNFGAGSGNSPTDMAIARLNPLGRTRIFTTYIGGSGNEQPHSLVVDVYGNVVIGGRTNSDNFPVVAKRGPQGGHDIVIFKLSADGTTRLGGLQIGGSGNDGVNITTDRSGPNSLCRNYGDDARSEVILDAANNVYMAASTQSTDFPVSAGAHQTALSGKQDAVVIKTDANLNFEAASYLGGSEDDAAFVLAISPVSGNLFVGGATASGGLRGANTNVLSSTYSDGGGDGYIAEFTPDLTTLQKFCYLGTNGFDLVYGVQFDKYGYPYVMGTTTGAWPVINANFRNDGAKQFVAKLNRDLSAFEFSTVFGSTRPPGFSAPDISPTAFLVDRCENMYVSGWGSTYMSNYAASMRGTGGMQVTPDAYNSSTDTDDFYFIVIQRDATNILYGTFFGQRGGFPEHVDGGTSRFDANGVIYQTMCANCNGNTSPRPTFPTTPGTVSPVNPSAECNIAMVKIHFDYAGVAATARPFINGILDSSGCVPLTVEFRDMIRNARSFVWDFGDGSPEETTTNFTISHTFTQTGIYRVRQIAVDPQSCNGRDTAYITIHVRNDRAELDFSYVKAGDCNSMDFEFSNTSTAPPGKPFGSDSFKWDFGDQSPIVGPMGPTPSVPHSFPAPGSYNVKLILTDTNYCNGPDTLARLLRLSPNVKAIINTPESGCAPYDAVFQNESLAGQRFYWDFGDGQTSTEVSPVHRYENPGTYTITLRAEDDFTCNRVHDTTVTIVVSAAPTANFSFSPVTPETNKPVVFTNTSSSDANWFKWQFGDGQMQETTDPITSVSHQYNATGTYNACLIVSNQYGCMDTVCRDVSAEIIPLLDVPSAFAPLQGGKINTIKVVGFGIDKMRFRIYNRWGQLMFESNDPQLGWDGRFRGVVQPMDVYTYTLEVTFTDGTRATKKGDITLIR